MRTFPEGTIVHMCLTSPQGETSILFSTLKTVTGIELRDYISNTIEERIKETKREFILKNLNIY
jgi:hypothetical protein